MSEILKVNTPTSGYENASRTQPISVNNTNVQNVVDMTKVTRSDGKSGNAEKELGLKYDSNFGTFLEILRNTPNITEILSEMLFQMGGDIDINSKSNFMLEISNLLNGMNFTEESLLNFIKEQSVASGKFNNNFFQNIQNILENTKSIDLQLEIMNFVKTYNDVSSSQSTLKNIQSLLKNISSYMTNNYKQPFENIIDKFIELNKFNTVNTTDIANTYGQQTELTNILKNEVIPFLGNYIKNTNNMGKVRDLITILTLNIVKYENGNIDKLETSFNRLMDFRDFKQVFSDISVDDLKRMITMETGTDFSKQFVELIKSGIKGEGGWETKSAFQEIMQSILVNESVYMPLSHFLVPANIAGRTMFSEIWVDPNHKEKNEKGQKENCKRLLIKFNIKDIGFFDLIITQKQSGIDLQLYYPEKLKKNENLIKKDISNIIEKNGMSLKTFSLNVLLKQKKLEEIFPQIYERINTVDVKI